MSYIYTFKYNFDAKKFECVHKCTNLQDYYAFEDKEDPKEYYQSFHYDTEQNPKLLAKQRDEQHADGVFFRCKECGKVTYNSASTRDWYTSRGLQTPKRCYKCIQRRKAERMNQVDKRPK